MTLREVGRVVYRNQEGRCFPGLDMHALYDAPVYPDWRWGFGEYHKLVHGLACASDMSRLASLWYTAQHCAAVAIHRHLLQGAIIERAALGAIWAAAWVHAGGDDHPDLAGYYWLRSYAQDVPCLRMGRHLVAVQPYLHAVYGCRGLGSRPDAVVQASDGAVEVLEFCPVLPIAADWSAVRILSARDHYVLQQCLAVVPHCMSRIILVSLENGQELDVTLAWAEVMGLL